MRGPLIGFAVAALAVTAGCGDRQERTYRDPTTGSEVRVQTGERMQPPRNLPDFSPIHPGARIENVMEGTSSGEGGADAGGMVVFHTDADPEAVARFYRERFDASGLSERSETRISGSLILSASSADGDGDGVQVSIVPAETGSGSTVSLVYSRAA